MIAPDKRTRPIPVGGLEQALYAGRHRRRRALGAGGGAVAALMTVAVLVADLGGGRARAELQIGDDPAPAATTSASSTASSTASPGDDPAVGGSPTGSANPQPTESFDPQCDINDCHEGDDLLYSQPTPAPHGDRRRAVVPYTERPEAKGSCGGGGLPGGGYCFRGGPFPDTIASGSTFVFAIYVCVHGSSSPDVLAFPSGQEHELVVSDARGNEVYRFSKTVTFTGGPHQRTVDAGTCLRWTMPWDTGTTAGPLVAPGRYTVTTQVVGAGAGTQAAPNGFTETHDFDVHS